MKYAVVTGCASGIGREVSLQLHNSGVKVFGLDIQSCDESFPSYVCEVSNESQVSRVIEEISKELEHIDYLINCAGMLSIGKPLMIKDMSFKQWDAIIKINLRSTVVMTKLLYPLLKNSSSSAIINISSEQSYNPDEGFSPYAVSKTGINSFTACAAKEFIEDNIRVNAVAFGTVKTNILKAFCDTNTEKELYLSKEKSIPLGVINVNEAANIVVDLLGDKYRHMTGEIIRIDGGNHFGL